HGLDDGGAADRDRARAVGAHAELHLVGIAVHDRDLADRNAQPLGDQLAERRLVTLAVAMRAREHLDGADRIDADLRRFPQTDAGAETADRLRGRDAAGFDVAGYAEAAQLAFGFRLGLARRETGVIDRLHGGIKGSMEVAGVVGHNDRRLVWEARD